MVKLGEGGGVEGLDPAPLGRGEVVGDGEGGEVVEGPADGAQPLLEPGGARRDRRGVRPGAQPPERIAQQRAPVGGVGAAEELYEAQRLARGKAVALGALEELALGLVVDLAQGAREGRPDGSPGQPLRSRR